ncbi:aldehyde ferredoxin oxidoreductase family protein [Mycoplasma sp. P36-A1]|uniref:aldehyde ferredoxin oxidoreductase family protein n=1 Tax=Mycoplasma sp. P36-A1 TaxID=3252900 RepID=UPI003C2ABB90
MNSYNGKVLRINLETKVITKEPLDQELAKKYIGGRGLGTAMLMQEIDIKVDPLSKDNKLILITGPLSGTRISTGTRYMAVTKSPLNNLIASSNSGGIWGSMLKYAGYDAIILEGKADKPVYIDIDDESISIQDASNVWTKTTEEATNIIKEELAYKSKDNAFVAPNLRKSTSVLAIGPGGENLSNMAAIMNEVDRAAGRSGVGAVMGSKNLKAIAITTNQKEIPTFNKEEFRKLIGSSAKTLKDHPVTGEGLPAYGTAVLVNIINSVGSFPTNNFLLGEFDKADDVSGETMAEKYLTKNTYCHHCTIGCGREVRMKDKIVGGPEYETLWGFSSDAGISDLESVIEANFWCNEMGLDTISASNTIACAMELYEKGLIKEEEVDGVPLKFGNSEAIIEWVKRMGTSYNELAIEMAKGSKSLALKYGAPELSMSVKGLEIPAYDPRGIQGIGLNYATSNRGACHVRGYTISPEILGAPQLVDRTITEGKADLVKVFQDLTAVIDSLGICLFTSFALGAPDYASIYNAAVGENLSDVEILEIGERIYNLEREFNRLAGMLPEDDNLPERLTKDALKNEASKDMVSRLDIMLPEYYEARGWINGFPTQETLKRLGIDI